MKYYTNNGRIYCPLISPLVFWNDDVSKNMNHCPGLLRRAKSQVRLIGLILKIDSSTKGRLEILRMTDGKITIFMLEAAGKVP